MTKKTKKANQAPEVVKVGNYYELQINGESIDGKQYRNDYIAGQAFLYWHSNTTEAVTFTESDIVAAQLADDEQPSNSE